MIRIIPQLITGDLSHDKLIVRHVGVQRCHDPVAITPGIRQRIAIAIATIAVTVASHIEPMPRPAFTVLSGFKKRIHNLRKGFGRFVCKKSRDLLGRRWQPSEIQKRSTNEQVSFCGNVRLQPCGFEPCKDETINI